MRAYTINCFFRKKGENEKSRRFISYRTNTFCFKSKLLFRLSIFYDNLRIRLNLYRNKFFKEVLLYTKKWKETKLNVGLCNFINIEIKKQT